MEWSCACTGACRVWPYRCPSGPQYSPNQVVAPPQPMYWPTQPMGCICPPTSEQTCNGQFCPRRNHLVSAVPALKDKP